jgi:thiol:disulfide interchange protein DsbA
MRLIQKILLTLGLVWMAGNALAVTPELGYEYQKISRPQQTDSGNKIEVIEFFAYYCPHCNALEPLLEQWLKKQGDNIVFRRIHVGGNEDLQFMQRLYFTLEAMGKVDDYHMKAFQAFHIDKNHLSNINDISNFVAKVGLDKQKFFDVYNSFSVQSKAQRATQMVSSYGIEGWPTFAVDGRYLTSPSMSVSRAAQRATEQEQNVEGLKMLDWMIAKVKSEKAVAAPAAKTTAKK